MNGGNSGAVPDGSGRVLVQRLRKQFGPVEAVRDLSFTVEPGRVTGFLGPNGAGKTTTLRIAVGLVRPDAGEVIINGVRYEQLSHPARVVGAVLDSQGFHPSRTALAHLRCYTAAIGVPDHRAEEVLTLVGLGDAARRKVGGFSLGMRQRLGLATALLGDPQVLILDEPGSGLDPEGLAWLRSFLRAFADAGRTVLISSHQLAEVEQTVDHVVIISEGTGVFAGRIDQLGGAGRRLHVQCADQVKLATALAQRGVTDIQALPEGGLAVAGANSTTVGEVALAAGVAIYGISEQPADLERHFFELTNGQYQGQVQSLGQPLDPSVFGPGSGAPAGAPHPAPSPSTPAPVTPTDPAGPAGPAGPADGDTTIPVTTWAPAPPPPVSETAADKPAAAPAPRMGTSAASATSEKPQPQEPTSSESPSEEPASAELGSSEPASREPGSSDGRSQDLAAPDGRSGDPASSEPTSQESGFSEPGFSEPGFSEPGFSEPPSPEPPSPEPQSPKPQSPEPQSEKSPTQEPASPEPASSDGRSQEPASAEPASSDGRSQGGRSQEPASAEPASSDGRSQGGRSQEPASAEPASSEPAAPESERAAPESIDAQPPSSGGPAQPTTTERSSSEEADASTDQNPPVPAPTDSASARLSSTSRTEKGGAE